MTPSAKSTTFLLENYTRQDVRFVRGAGCRLWDDAGREYLDAFAGVAVNALGHAHPRMTEALCHQVRTLIHVSNHYGVPEQEVLAERIVGCAFPGRVYFCNSGTEATEAAYKAVRLWSNREGAPRRGRVIAFEGGFHGRTLGALSLTGNAAYRTPFAPLFPAEFLPFGDEARLRGAVREDLAAVIVEPIQGEGGVRVAPPGFLELLRAECDRVGALLIVDEIQTGMGRTGRMFAYEHAGIRPDVVLLAKGLGGGVPIGAVLLSEPLAALFKPGSHGTTFGGNPLACAAGAVVMHELESPGFLENVAHRGAQVVEGLRSLFGGHEVRGRGLLVGVQLGEDPGPLVRAASAEGLVVGTCAGNTLRIAPPLVFSSAEVDELLEKLAAARRRLARVGA